MVAGLMEAPIARGVYLGSRADEYGRVHTLRHTDSRHYLPLSNLPGTHGVHVAQTIRELLNKQWTMFGDAVSLLSQIDYQNTEPERLRELFEPFRKYLPRMIFRRQLAGLRTASLAIKLGLSEFNGSEDLRLVYRDLSDTVGIYASTVENGVRTFTGVSHEIFGSNAPSIFGDEPQVHKELGEWREEIKRWIGRSSPTLREQVLEELAALDRAFKQALHDSGQPTELHEKF